MQELSGAVKAGLDKQLAPAVAAGLGKPLQEAFRSAFTKQVCCQQSRTRAVACIRRCAFCRV